MTSRSRIVLASFALTAAALAGCSSNGQARDTSSTPRVAVINATCPYSNAAVNPKYTSTFNEMSVGFCCAGCKGRFDKSSETDKGALLSSKNIWK
jgi:hypothetical protein